MILTINEDICKFYNLTLPEVLVVTLIKTGINITELFKNLEEKQVLVKDMFNNYLVTSRYDDEVCSVLLDSDKDHKSQDSIEELAIKMMEFFPALKKQGSSQYFKGNKRDITLRLKKFFKLYGDTYTDEVILAATKKYVESFNGNYTYMRVLKYFIWKDQKKLNSEGEGYIEEVSDLANFIENNGKEFNSEWSTNMR